MDKYTFIIRFDYVKGNEELSGSFSRIFLVKDKENKAYICKRIYKSQCHENEWILPMKINTPRVTNFTDIIEEKIIIHDKPYTFYYLISEYFHYQDLFKYMLTIIHDKQKRIEYFPIMFKNCSKCIKDCHDSGVVHLDIKPENFLVISDEEYQLIDFAFSKQIYHKTFVTKRKGTELYISPEMYHDGKCSLKSDIYSLGMMMLVFLYPSYFNFKNASFRFFFKITNHIKLNMLEMNPLEQYLLKLVSYNPDERPTINEVLDFLQKH